MTTPAILQHLDDVRRHSMLTHADTSPTAASVPDGITTRRGPAAGEGPAPLQNHCGARSKDDLIILAPGLASVICKEGHCNKRLTERTAMRLLGQYIEFHKLRSTADRNVIHCDQALEALSGKTVMSLKDAQHLVQQHSYPAPDEVWNAVGEALKRQGEQVKFKEVCTYVFDTLGAKPQQRCAKTDG